MLRARSAVIGRYAGSAAFCRSTTAAIRCERCAHLGWRANAVQQPICDVLAGDAQRSAILHERDVVKIRHLGTADAEVDPTHHVAENALRVVVDLLLDFRRRPRWTADQRRGELCLERRRRTVREELLLYPVHIDLVIMQSMQGGCRGRGHPAVFAPASGCAILLRTMSAMRSGMAHIPLPICARPRRPQASPTSTLRRS